jgi:hypothetical protein
LEATSYVTAGTAAVTGVEPGPVTTNAPGAVIVAGAISLLKAAVIASFVGILSVGPGDVVAGTVATTVGMTPIPPGSVHDPPPPPPHPDRILTNTLITTIQTRYAFCDKNLFINPPFK